MAAGRKQDGAHRAVGKRLRVEARGSFGVLVVPETDGVLGHVRSFRLSIPLGLHLEDDPPAPGRHDTRKNRRDEQRAEQSRARPSARMICCSKQVVDQRKNNQIKDVEIRAKDLKTLRISNESVMRKFGCASLNADHLLLYSAERASSSGFVASRRHRATRTQVSAQKPRHTATLTERNYAATRLALHPLRKSN